MSADILATRHHSLGQLTLDRPLAMNSLSLEMVRTLTHHLREWQSNPDVQAVLIDSSTPKAFCAGGDIHFFHEVGSAGLQGGSALLEDFFTEEYALNHLIHHYPKPYIALLDGIVMGGGMGITQSSAAGCVRIVTERTRMAMPEVKIGLFPDVGGGYFLSRLPGKIGTWMALTGEIIGTADILYAKLAHVFIPRKVLPELIPALQTTTAGSHQQIIEDAAHPFREQIDPHSSQLAQHRTLIDQHFGHDSVAEIMASLQTDDSDFARKTLASIAQRSPLMVCVAFEQIRRAADMSVADCLRMERTMVRRCFERGEVIEGIRALAIDKDQQPRWQPDTLEAISAEMIAPFFESAWPNYAHPLRELT